MDYNVLRHHSRLSELTFEVDRLSNAMDHDAGSALSNCQELPIQWKNWTA